MNKIILFLLPVLLLISCDELDLVNDVLNIGSIAAEFEQIEGEEFTSFGSSEQRYLEVTRASSISDKVDLTLYDKSLLGNKEDEISLTFNCDDKKKICQTDVGSAVEYYSISINSGLNSIDLKEFNTENDELLNFNKYSK